MYMRVINSLFKEHCIDIKTFLSNLEIQSDNLQKINKLGEVIFYFLLLNLNTFTISSSFFFFEKGKKNMVTNVFLSKKVTMVIPDITSMTSLTRFVYLLNLRQFLKLDTIPKAFSQAATSQRYFPKC